MRSTLLASLNESQRTAASHIDGPLLMLAGPGSGKTRAITYRIAHMIECGIEPEGILALTFTNKAAQEMRSRLEQLVGPSPVWLGTFHGFCARLLRRYARLVGIPENYSIYDADDAQSALKNAAAEVDFELTHVSVGTLANKISYFKNRLITPEVLEAEALSSEEHQASQVYPAYQKRLLQCGAVDFDDLLLHSATLLRENPDLRSSLDRQFRYIMVDEYQDTNLAQYVIIRHLSVDNPNLAVTGDPDQSIYGWRGANIKNVAHLEKDYPGLKTVRLEDNYRSTPEILSTADYLIRYNIHRKEKTLVPSRESGEQVRLVVYPTARDEANDIADQIQSIVVEDEQSWNDFGVLYRTNAQSRLIEQALTRRQIPYQLIGGFRFYLRKEIKDLVAYLLLLHNPDDDIALRRAINTPARGIGKKTVEQIATLGGQQGISMLTAAGQAVESGALSKRASAAVGSFLKIYDQLVSILHGPLVDLLETTIELTKYREHLAKTNAKQNDNADTTENLDELLAEAGEMDQLAALNQGQSALEQFLELVALQADTDRLDSRQDCVTLMTLHAAKGLEFSSVYLMAVEENILPHARSKDDAFALEEERRLLFVGITRAKDRLQLSYAKSRGFHNAGTGVPSSFLMELPRHEMQVIDRTQQHDEYYDAGPGFDDFHHTAPATWDEYSQVPIEDGNNGAIAFDDDCQLPPEEIAQRLRAKLTRATGTSLRSAAELETSQQWSGFYIGAKVNHPEYGIGEIIAHGGHGTKRSVTINFLASQTQRTFRLAHAGLQLLDQN